LSSRESPDCRQAGYGELIGGRYFDLPMKWNGKLGNDLVAEGQAKPKPPFAYKIVGQSPPRFDVPAKVFGTLDYVTDVKVPGMLHGRMIRPPVAGAVPVDVRQADAVSAKRCRAPQAGTAEEIDAAAGLSQMPAQLLR
jgi:nicotinate dehydrogenase subunit B